MRARHLTLIPSTPTTLPSSMPSETCTRCNFDPCACSYIADLRVGGRLEQLRPIALAEYGKPAPHRTACPCPRCYSLRLSTWTARLITPTRSTP